MFDGPICYTLRLCLNLFTIGFSVHIGLMYIYISIMLYIALFMCIIVLMENDQSSSYVVFINTLMATLYQYMCIYVMKSSNLVSLSCVVR